MRRVGSHCARPIAVRSFLRAWLRWPRCGTDYDPSPTPSAVRFPSMPLPAAAPTLSDISAAQQRIGSAVRRTPMVTAHPAGEAAIEDCDLQMKLESLQITGSFKARGAVNRIAALTEEERARGVITVSAGNHAQAVAYAASRLGVRATLVLPENAAPDKIAALARWPNADVIVRGAVWDDARDTMLSLQAQSGATFIHPFRDPGVIAGQGTVGLECLDQVPGADTIVVAIGGGGLISGTAIAAKALNPHIRVIGVEAVGAPTLYESRRQRAPALLDAITTRAASIAPRTTEAINHGIIDTLVDDIVLVDDNAMTEAARWLWREHGVAAELAGAATLAALTTGAYRPDRASTVIVIVCGVGTVGLEFDKHPFR